jgi:hypothetical protein
MKLQKFPAPCPLAGHSVSMNSLRAGVMPKYTWILSFGKDDAARSQYYPF